jgi:murein DD-endopeptidase MepM/ murein hydrolase activator NlpD
MKKKIVAIITAILLTTQMTAMATETGQYQDKIEENQEKINELNQEKNEIQDKKQKVNAELEKMIQSINSLNQEIAALNTEISVKSSLIEKKSGEITAMEQKIVELENNITIQAAHIKAKEEELKTQQDILSERVRAAYKYNSFGNIIFTLMESTSIIDFTERLMFIEKMAEKDHEIIATIDAIIVELDATKASLEASKVEAETTRTTLTQEKAFLEKEKNTLVQSKAAVESKLKEQRNLEYEKKALINAMTEEERQLSTNIGDIMEENEELEAEIQRLIREAQEKARKEEEERKKAEAAAGGGSGSGSNTEVSTGYIRPVSGRITSYYGNRVHPIYGDIRFHTGVDFASSYGTGIKATKAGKVILRSYHSGYGNYMIIDHGNGISSLYAHMSGFNATVGQTVAQGQIIGFIGSTGASTGPHLHFEIRVNGNHVNPMTYLD